MFVKLLIKQAMVLGLMLSLVSSVSGWDHPIMFLDGFEGWLGGEGVTSVADENGALTIAATELCGNVYDGDGGPLGAGSYLVTCDVVVPQGQILTINPGAQVYFRLGFKIIANGTLFANGNPDEPVYLASELTFHRGMKLTARLQLQNGGELKPGPRTKNEEVNVRFISKQNAN